MALPVINGGMSPSPVGVAPGTWAVLPSSMVLFENMPVATIFDNIPFANIAPFGVCTSLANPITAAQTAAALGVLTPGACIPVLPAPGVPGGPTVMIGGKPALDMTSKCMCA